MLIGAESPTTGEALWHLAEALWFVFLIVGMGATAYRVGRFISLDTLWDETRDRLYGWLTTGDKLSMWKLKLHELLTCPFCITGWTSLGVVVGVDIVHHLDLIFIQWMATWVVALCWWGLIDSDDGPKMEHGK